MSTAYRPRPNQVEVLAYRAGKMGVAAVPGSGKTWTLSRLAADLLLENRLQEGQEILVVTLTNSAVDNFSSRVESFLKADGHKWALIPNYRVRTLHGLAHDIVRERPALAGLAEDFQIIDEKAADDIRAEVARAWLQSHPDGLDDYLDPEMDDGKREWVRRQQFPDLVTEIALTFIRTAKDQLLTPEALRRRLDELPFTQPLLEMGYSMYRDYQRALAYRGAVDFDDLIRLALFALEADPEYQARLRERWPYILEDEAQDSSALQERILRLLTGPAGNWVRVGDPNQAIFESFTTASPEYLRKFMSDPYVEKQELPNSGRSARQIIHLANEFVRWVMQEHPLLEVRDALQAPPWIEPTPEGDPQPNPPDVPGGIRLVRRKYTPQEEIIAVVDSIERWLVDHAHQTIAVLAPRNTRAFELVDELKRRQIEYHDGLLRSSSSTRTTAGVLGNLLSALADPQSPRKLATTYRVWQRAALADPETASAIERVAGILRKCEQVEDYLWPGVEGDWLESTALAEAEPFAREQLLAFRELARHWQQAAGLPVDQIILTLAQDLFSEPTDLAIAHKLAGLLRMASDLHPDWRLGELTQELAVIARNERRFLGFSRDDTGFDPDADDLKGKVVVATLHKAKGLEWDRVYILSANNYDFPSGARYDSYIGEKWYLRERLNLEAETRTRLHALIEINSHDWPDDGEATGWARLEYIRERLRLLYVGITRARRELVITWNTGRRGELQPAVSYVALQELWKEGQDETAG
jgi:DNA helicase II / ATP-dependent DNA helicase PcrA